ncbi:DUF2167 domain-containing protein [Pseudoluteimonas lycopersici]|uniref:DUF2167 domain-containing protein n=2 Tax=Pseudoluteimonas lycopersici TaxID=1324796 RepID=A0A516V6B7_9GAMM|nr:DUF2167 domain-containing protein [Lysobacter lycopersici]
MRGMTMRGLCAALAIALLAPGMAWAQDNNEDAKAAQLVSSLHFRQGDVALAQADAHLNLGSQFRFLDTPDARKVLEDLWGNPPDDSVLGMVVPTSVPLDDEHSWAVVLTEADDGHVSDEDAAETDYPKLLKQMQEETEDSNAERKKAGYSALHLVGWAEPPHYDSASKKLYWARELSAEGAPQHTLNYDIRVLGRSGYLSMNAVAGMNDVAAVKAGMQELLPMVDFEAGKRYADYDPKTDKLAAYGIAALIGGGIAAKAGLFAKLGVLLLAAKKFIVLGLAALAGLWRKFFGKKTGTVN